MLCVTNIQTRDETHDSVAQVYKQQWFPFVCAAVGELFSVSQNKYFKLKDNR